MVRYFMSCLYRGTRKGTTNKFFTSPGMRFYAQETRKICCKEKQDVFTGPIKQTLTSLNKNSYQRKSLSLEFLNKPDRFVVISEICHRRTAHLATWHTRFDRTRV